ncbi:hypothetical protein ACHAWF_001344 [Thalassiosira exigua]
MYGCGGYGGFGYDTSHVPRDEPKCKLTRQIERGDAAAVRRTVQAAAAVSDEEKRNVANHARRWTEKDYKMSGFAKTYEWFDVTPVATAARKGREDIVQFLLEQGADPTLEGCPYDDEYWDALKAANHALRQSQRTGDSAGPRRCVDLINVANLLWGKANYSAARYSKDRRKSFSNRPTSEKELARALAEVPNVESYPDGCLTEEDLQRLKEKYRRDVDAAPAEKKAPAGSRSTALYRGNQQPKNTLDKYFSKKKKVATPVTRASSSRSSGPKKRGAADNVASSKKQKTKQRT